MKTGWTFLIVGFWVSVFAFAVISGINRIAWVNNNAFTIKGAIQPSVLSQKTNVELIPECKSTSVTHIEFATTDTQLILRCGWFGSGSVTFWPFYSKMVIDNKKVMREIKKVFLNDEGATF